tara:strand:- start:21 stop:581 length:561 start_codon:yes stop_codon:yes gene_type:complete
MKRLFDLLMCSIVIIILAMPMLVIYMAVISSSKGPGIYWSKRIGKNNKIFEMPKFRSMKLNTPDKASHLISDPSDFITPIGNFLRRYSLDELPQLFSVLKNEMSLIGPRPALFNQNELIQLRTQKGVDKLLPGVTGWAQVNGRDELSIPKKVELDLEYLVKKSMLFDLRIIWMTLLKVISKDGVAH